jgi:hypothetical protein
MSILVEAICHQIFSPAGVPGNINRGFVEQATDLLARVLASCRG